MKLILEVVKSDGDSWSWFKQKAETHPGYAIAQRGSLEVHYLEFSTVEEMAGFFDLAKGFPLISVYKDGLLLTRADAETLVKNASMESAELSAFVKVLQATTRANIGKLKK